MPVLTTSGAVALRAGKNASPDIINNQDKIISFISGAEAVVNSMTRKNWNDVYSTLTNEKRMLLDEAVSSYAAMNVIAYDMSGYTSRTEAETKLDVLRDMFDRARKLLENKDTVSFVS